MTFKIYLILTFTILSPIVLKADFCFKSFEKDTAEAQAIFVGKLIQVSPNTYWYNNKCKSIFTFELTESFKGINSYVELVSILSPLHGCCNERFIKDSTYLVFAYSNCENSNIYWSNDCSNTGLLSQEISNYNQLKNKTLHKLSGRKKEFVNKSSLNIDSLKLKSSQLSIKLQRVDEINSELTRQIFILSAFVILFILLLIFTQIRKKRNANKV